MDSARDQKIIELFHSLIRYDGPNAIVVSGDKNDFLLETDIVFVHPQIPREQLANIRYRFNTEEAVDGTFLCTVTDKHRDVPVDNCLLTSRGIWWWDTDKKDRCALSYRDIDMAYPSPVYPRRGLNISKRIREDKESMQFIQLYVHDALLDALASFLCGACELIGRFTIDLNNASLEQLLALPVMSNGRAQKLIDARNARRGFLTMLEVSEALGLHPQEASALKAETVLNRYRPPKEAGVRRVDY